MNGTVVIQLEVQKYTITIILFNHNNPFGLSEQARLAVTTKLLDRMHTCERDTFGPAHFAHEIKTADATISVFEPTGRSFDAPVICWV